MASSARVAFRCDDPPTARAGATRLRSPSSASTSASSRARPASTTRPRPRPASPPSTPTRLTCGSSWEAERPGPVVFETGTVAGRVADACAEPGLRLPHRRHDGGVGRAQAQAAHHGRGEVMRREGPSGRMTSPRGHAGGPPIGAAMSATGCEPTAAGRGERDGPSPTGTPAARPTPAPPTTPHGVAGATAIGARIGDLSTSVVGADRGRAGVRATGRARPATATSAAPATLFAAILVRIGRLRRRRAPDECLLASGRSAIEPKRTGMVRREGRERDRGTSGRGWSGRPLGPPACRRSRSPSLRP